MIEFPHLEVVFRILFIVLAIVLAYAIFDFKDGRTKMVNKVRLLTDAGVGHENRWAKKQIKNLIYVAITRAR